VLVAHPDVAADNEPIMKARRDNVMVSGCICKYSLLVNKRRSGAGFWKETTQPSKRRYSLWGNCRHNRWLCK
jgi:hypothetical protein